MNIKWSSRRKNLRKKRPLSPAAATTAANDDDENPPNKKIDESSRRSAPARWIKGNGNKLAAPDVERTLSSCPQHSTASRTGQLTDPEQQQKHQQQLTYVRFRIDRKVGSGTFSTVHVATHRATNHAVALKMLSRRKIYDLKTQNRVRSEIDHLRLCTAHPHITRLYDTIDSAGAPTLDLVMEFVSGGDMYDHLKSMKPRRRLRAGAGLIKTSGLDEVDARRYFQQLISAVEFMHSKGVVHRDLKLENILLDPLYRYIKLADFGLSAAVDTRPGAATYLKTPCGSPHYAAPEVISGKPYLGRPSDIWSCGVILYAMLAGKLPFVDSDMRKQFRRIKAGSYSIPRYLGRDSTSIIRNMLTVRVDRRITVEKMRQHLWFQVALPEYLNCTPELTEIRERKELDVEIMDEVMELYGCGLDGKLSQDGLERVIALGFGLDNTIELYNGYGEEMRDAHTAYQLLLDTKHEKQRSEELFNAVDSCGASGTGVGSGRSGWMNSLLNRNTKSTVAIMLCLILTLCGSQSNCVMHHFGGSDEVTLQGSQHSTGNTTWGSLFMSLQSQFYTTDPPAKPW
eukprot:CAMPEP_0178474468 /NCGR_PEP_ID=MMETSP0696-20121128/2615_1 /TAXON_ID=265572 /ORGANISM="Extubocellulus spinifer, Strain CCMP396" /LENGTH=568 /DNA_ID=CAMNT_0020101717 /DNA_START=126 /DNA_END=1829 /DNA_ORIENTATION=+